MPEEMDKYFNLGYKSSRFAPLGNAIKSTIAAYNQQNQLESGLAAKYGMERLFQDPLERQHKQAQIQNVENQGAYRQGMLDVANRRADIQSKRVTSLDIQKNKDLQKLQDTTTNYSLQRQDIEDALSSLERIPKDFIGQQMLGFQGAMGSQSPVLKDIQRLRTILGTETIKGRAGMPGSMSDQDREFLREMAGNTSTLSVPRIQEVLTRNLKKISSLDESMKNTFNMKYNIFGSPDGQTSEDDRIAQFQQIMDEMENQ